MKKVVGCPSCGVLEEFIAYPLLPFQQIGICVTKCWMKLILLEMWFLRLQKHKWCIPAFTKIKLRKFMIYVQPKDEDPAILKQISVSGLEDIKNALLQILKS